MKTFVHNASALAGLLCLWLPALGQLGYTESGEASFYADRFNGQLTASGERLDNRALTAAHRILPFGTKVLVTNLANSKSVVVRITDRGPFKKGRILDLTKAGATTLGFLEKGIAHITLEVVDVPEGASAPPTTQAATADPGPSAAAPAPSPKPQASPNVAPSASAFVPPAHTPAAETPFARGGTYNLWGKAVVYDGFCLQLGALADLEKAKALAIRVKDAGWPTVYIRVQGTEAAPLYKVVEGVYPSEAAARAAQVNLKAKGFACFLSHYRQ